VIVNDPSSLAVVERNAPGRDEWFAAPSLPEPRAGLAAVSSGASLYALGGGWTVTWNRWFETYTWNLFTSSFVLPVQG
jgi:hypothetical protein